MAEFLILLLSISVSGGLLVILLFGLRRLLGRKLSGIWMYYIWTIAALRLLLPFTPQQSVLNHAFQDFGRIRQEQAFMETTGADTALSPDTLSLEETAEETPLPALPETSSQSSVNAQELGETSDTNPSEMPQRAGIIPSLLTVARDSLPELLFSLWFLTALFLFLRALVSSCTFLRRIHRHAVPIASPEIGACYEKACTRLSIRRPPRLLVSPGARSPMLTGILRPAIVLPAGSLTCTKNLPYIFLHELTHYQRKDIWYKWLFLLVECIHFFNPLSYLLRREVERCCELSCDEAVCKDMTFQERKDYGVTLLDALEPDAVFPSPVTSASLCENAAFIKERLVMIKMKKEKSRFLKIVTPVLTAGLCFSAFYLGAYAAPADYSMPGNTSPIPSLKQSSAFRENAAIPLSAGKKADSPADTESPAGYTLLKTETFSLSDIQSLQILLSYEEVTLYPSPDNTVTLLFYGNNSWTYAENEIAAVRQEWKTLTVKSGERNKAWNKLSAEKWQPKVFLYLPADFAGKLDVEIGSGSLESTTSLQAASASFDTSSGKMTLMDVGVKDRLTISNHSGSTTAGNLTGVQCGLDNSSGRLTLKTITAQSGCTLNNASGKFTAGNITSAQCSAVNQSGHLYLENLTSSGKLELTTVSGPVSAGQVSSGEYTVSTNSGSMETRSLTGWGSLTCGSGHILTGSLFPTGNLSMETGSGQIQAAIPENTGLDFTISSVGSGSIDTFFPIPDYKKTGSSVSSRYGSAPYYAVTAGTGSGSILIEKQANTPQ